MSDIVVVMLGHKSLAGKDTVFGFAEELGFKRVAFADKLKTTCMDLFNLSHDQVFGEGKDIMDERYPNTRDDKIINMLQSEAIERGLELLDRVGLTTNSKGEPEDLYEVENPDYKPFLTPRRILQLFGQDQRSLFPNIWASYIFTTAIPELVAQGEKKIIVTDFRFPNEAVAAAQWANQSTNNHLHMYKIHRPGVVAKTGSNDISETALDDFQDWTGTILNDGDLGTLKSRSVKVLSGIIDSTFLRSSTAQTVS